MTDTRELLETLSQLAPDQRKIVLDPAVTTATKAALLAGGYINKVVPMLNMLENMTGGAQTAVTPPAPMSHYPLPPTRAPQMPPVNSTATYDPGAVQDVVNMLSGGGQTPLTYRQAVKMDETMTRLLATLSDDKAPFTGGGTTGGTRGDKTDTVMQVILTPGQHGTWKKTGQLNDLSTSQRAMLEEVSLGHSLGRVMTRDQMRILSGGGTPGTTLRQRYVAGDLLRHPNIVSHMVMPMMTWGTQLDTSPIRDIII